MNRRLQDKESKANEIKDAFMDFKREILKGAENSRTGKPIPPKLIKSFEEGDRERDDEVEKLRLTNINRRNVLRKLEQTLRQKEKLADGLHLIDFEQLKIENQTLNEKIEERNEELLKLRKKTTTTCRCSPTSRRSCSSCRPRTSCSSTTSPTSRSTSPRSATCSRRRSTSANSSARQQRGLVSSEELLLDFEKRRQSIVAKQEELAALKARHAAVTRQAAAAKARGRGGGRAVRRAVGLRRTKW